MINHQIPSQKSTTMIITLIVDLLVLNIFLYGAICLLPTLDVPYVFAMWNVSYLVPFFVIPPVAIVRIVRNDFVMERSLWTSVLMMVIFMMLNFLFKNVGISNMHMLILSVCTVLVLLLSRLIDKKIASVLRANNHDNCDVVFLGAGVNLKELYNTIKDPGTGYNVHGYFQDKESKNLSGLLPQLGTLSEIVDYLKNHRVDAVICNLDQNHESDIIRVMNYCENHLIKFYSVLNTQNYMNRAMNLEFIDKYPIISMRKEPLTNPFNRGLKRAFDLVVTIPALILLLPIMLLVALIIKISSPGPVFFIQERTGKDGKNFNCYKFRSMKVNKDADKVQATANDPRKYPFGNFMRKTNIDELPQFFNVLIGNMSLVGPRPHMLAHTDQYGSLVDKYMVRHYAKPGITGWAQVTGSRGETKELWQMEERIKKDIWYLENWTLWLDIRIMWRTVTNVICRRDKETAY